MKKILFAMALSCLSLPLVSAHEGDFNLEAQYQYELELAHQSQTPNFPPLDLRSELGKSSDLRAKFSYVDPQNLIRKSLLDSALEVYDQNPKTFTNRNYITIIDFLISSDQVRFFLIDMKTGLVEALHTAHGEGSDVNDDGVAESFSNISGSKQSSLGIYRTAETYSGSFGYSLRLDGLSATNSQVRNRAIVVHGWSKMNDKNVKQIRSWGCPALSESQRDQVIEKIKEGSLIFAGY